MLAMVLQSVNIPVEGIALVAGIDRIFDMGRTTINITGDAGLRSGGLQDGGPQGGPHQECFGLIKEQRAGPGPFGPGPAALFEGPVCMEAIGL